VRGIPALTALVLVLTLFFAAAPAEGAAFRIEYLAARNPAESEVLELLRSSERLHAIVRELNDFLRLPFPVRLEVGGAAEGPYYDSATRTIALPYAFPAKYTDSAGAPIWEGLVLNLAAFVFCHEVGHVLIHALDLTGRVPEEPTADDLAVLLTADLLGEGLSMAASLETWWARHGRLPREPFDTSPHEWREMERRLRILCLLRGSDPVGGTSPSLSAREGAEGAADCRAEYLRMRDDRLEMLRPLLRRSPFD
jgi:hypothetical protein